METKKEQTKKISSNKKSGIINGTANVIAAAGIGVASYAYGKSKSPVDMQNEEVQDISTKTDAKEQLVNVDGQQSTVESISEDKGGNVDVESAVEPEPIANTDGIDMVVEIEGSHEIAGIDEIIPEPILPEPEIDLVATNESECVRELPNGDITETGIPIDCVENDIQSDLLA